MPICHFEDDDTEEMVAKRNIILHLEIYDLIKIGIGNLWTLDATPNEKCSQSRTIVGVELLTSNLMTALLYSKVGGPRNCEKEN